MPVHENRAKKVHEERQEPIRIIMTDQTFYIIELDGVFQPMHYDTYNEAYNGIIAAFKEKPETKCGGIAKCTYKDLNVTIKNK